MISGNTKKSKLISSSSWPRTLVKKWFNIRNKAEDFYADHHHHHHLFHKGGDEDWRKFSEKEAARCNIKKKSKKDRSRKRNSERPRGGKIEFEASDVTDVQNYRIFVATWNVAGKSPPSNLNLDDWLHSSPPADIYVLGFQEIVPLNAGNVLGTEDNGPAKRWLTLIRRTLNTLPAGGYCPPSPVSDPIFESDADTEVPTTRQTTATSSYFHRRSFQAFSRRSTSTAKSELLNPMTQPGLDRRHSVCERVGFDQPRRWVTSYNNECGGNFFPVEEIVGRRGQSRYCLVASKQMVGILLTVWIRSGIRNRVHSLKVSCVGTGLMGYLGNKGSISISMVVNQTSFCFICSHLTSGQKEGDELRRNSDVMEIIKKTRFPRASFDTNSSSPRTILEHDQIIWLGDLNYRIALSYSSAKALVEMRNWKALLENDQLRIEQRQGRVFTGWREGKIHFPPTYKFSNNSDRYTGEARQQCLKEKRRTPAWCDRILWHGRGLHQLSYVRGESRFSDHRPVYSLFLAEVESAVNQCRRIKKCRSGSSSGSSSSSCSSARIEVEELLPPHYSNVL